MCAMLRYLFVDMNSFFATVEQQDRPALRGRPVGVIPNDTLSTCCIAVSYEAKAFGVKTGTGAREALKLCPHIALVLARPQRYVEVHHRIVAAAESCLHLDRVCSIDEMYGRLLGQERRPEHAAAIAYKVKAAIRGVGEALRCSIGIAPNAWLAKVASDMQKPDGLFMIQAHQLPEILCRLALDDLPGVAHGLMQRLERHGVKTIAQLYQLNVDQLAAVWGSRVLATLWWEQLRGYDVAYQPTRRRTVGHSHVLPPQRRTPEQARAVLVRMIHKAAARMRRLGYYAGRLDVTVEYLGGQRWGRWAHVAPPSRDTLTLLQVFGRLWNAAPGSDPFHVGVVLGDLIADSCATIPLHARQRHLSALADVMDRLDRKYGHHTVYFAGMFGARDSAPTRISYTQIPAFDEF